MKVVRVANTKPANYHNVNKSLGRWPESAAHWWAFADSTHPTLTTDHGSLTTNMALKLGRFRVKPGGKVSLSD